ncbi:MAG: hypothetical protein IH628_15720 [Proteobacteria bacterium]|nr:hypothetical protein [Pseudomonadota bacterium]
MAEPGDVLFGIIHREGRAPGERLAGIRRWIECARDRAKSWRGIDRDDWHVGIFLESRKRKRHSRINGWFIHSTVARGVHVQQFAPGIFSAKEPGARTRVEILRLDGITESQQEAVSGFARSKAGCGFDLSGGKSLTYALGLPNVLHPPGRYTCQHFVMAAYGAAGVHFPHPTESFPFFNIGRYLGRPLGHPGDRVNLRYPYLMDHHIYRDPRFVLRAAIYLDPEIRRIVLQTDNLRKYSWSPERQGRYDLRPQGPDGPDIRPFP